MRACRTLKRRQTEGFPRPSQIHTVSYRCALSSGSRHGTTRHHPVSCYWLSSWCSQSPYPWPGRETHPAALWQRSRPWAFCRAAYPAGCHGWTAAGRWALWCGSQKIWRPSSLCSTWAMSSRQTACRRWPAPALPHSHSWISGHHGYWS